MYLYVVGNKLRQLLYSCVPTDATLTVGMSCRILGANKQELITLIINTLFQPVHGRHDTLKFFHTKIPVTVIKSDACT